MKTIAMCAALTALAFWLLPNSNVKNAAKQAEPMVLLVETAACLLLTVCRKRRKSRTKTRKRSGF